MGGSSKKQTVGYKYYCTEHLALCMEADSVRRLWVGDKLAWSGNAAVDTTIDVDKPGLFGGEEKEGGFVGPIEIHGGAASQAPSAYLEEQMGPLPAFKGIVTAIAKKCYQSAMNPYLKNKVFEVVRQWQGWYPEKSKSGLDVNGVHILYEIYTNSVWGRSLPTTMMNDVEWRAAADSCYEEGLFLGIAWRPGQDLDDFIQEVVEHVGCVLREDRKTGKWGIKLLRADYNPQDLLVLDESNCDLLKHSENKWISAANKFVGRWTDPETLEETTITSHSPATRRMAGQEVIEAKNYRGAMSAELCARLLERDKRIAITPHMNVRIRASRLAASLDRGDVFRLQWGQPVINDVVMRVLDIDYGKPGGSGVVVEAATDVFDLPSGSYLTTQPLTSGSPFPAPVAAENQVLFEASYWHLANELGDASAQMAVTSTSAWVAALVALPATGLYRYKALFEMGAVSDESYDVFAPFGETDEPLVPELVSIVNLVNASQLDDIELGQLALLGAEWVAITAVDANNQRVTVKRGLLDTAPIFHAAGSRLFVSDGSPPGPADELLTGALVGFKAITLASSAALDEADAPRTTLALSNRAYRPLCPGNVRFNGLLFPTTIKDDVVVSWASRNRLTQTGGTFDWDSESITPEDGTTYSLRLLRGQTLLRTVADLTDTTYTYTPQMEAVDAGGVHTELTVEVWSVRDGEPSWQVFSHTFERKFTSTGDGYDLTAVDDGTTTYNLTGVAN